MFGLVLLREWVQISTLTMRMQVSGAWNADVAINDTGHTGVTLTTWLKSPRLLSCPRHKEVDAFLLSGTSWPRMAARVCSGKPSPLPILLRAAEGDSLERDM